MKRLPLLIVAMIFLASCSGSANTAAHAIESYFQTLVAKNESKIATLSCAAWEADARRDSRTFAEFPATADQVQCKESGKDGEFTTVACTGKLTLDYNGDKQQIDLSAREYRAIQAGGAWKMCGYK
jgi:hypothetical protein